MTLRLAASIAAAILLACRPAHAGRPMVVDDATILEPGTCQVESWTQRPSGRSEYWAVPTCRVGAWELGAGLGAILPDGGSHYRSRVLQAKTIFHPLQTNGWGIGLTIADQYRQGNGVVGDVSVLVPLTVSLLDDRVLVHANAGWLRQHGNGSGALWAVGAEWAAQPRLTLTLETYGTQRGHGYVQAGLAFAAIPDRLVLDAGVGQRLGRWGLERYLTVGLTWVFPGLR
ncbi:hypothetical protein QPK32_20995 [Massilia sp. YIM B02763]|uniref:hypothetical protein n=1 Tax=Massilia sp. YIM B02763 TaxID=3050130 RepID=UPI0025B683B5|nr:hypothetical protein [Massilia sp. YIM B02763]MDN4055550.1 hypothetical protein [Massilia sp. YIM B02763]